MKAIGNRRLTEEEGYLKRKRIALSLFWAVLPSATSLFAQNVITDWNTIASAAIDTNGGEALGASGIWFADGSIGVYDAVNATVPSGQASETTQGWSDWFSEGKALWTSGNYSAAAHAFREALSIAVHSDVTDRQLAELHGALAGVYANTGQFLESEGEYRCALALVKRTEGQASLNYAVLLAGMAILPTQSGSSEEVVALLRKAVAANVRSGYSKNITVIRECLAQILRKAKRYQEEEPLLLDAITDLTKQKADPALMGAALSNLAVLRFDQQRYEESINLQEKSIRVWETSAKEHPAMIVPLNDLATAYIRLGRFDDADVTYRRAIDICRKTLGENQIYYAVLLKNYAFVLRKLGHGREAKKMETQGQMIEEAASRRNGMGVTINVAGLPHDRTANAPGSEFR